jgi:hypothetical protein
VPFQNTIFETSSTVFTALLGRTVHSPITAPCPYLNGQGKGRLLFGFVQPIWRLVVVTVKLILIFTSDRAGFHVRRGVFDDVSGEAKVDFGICPTYSLDPQR